MKTFLRQSLLILATATATISTSVAGDYPSDYTLVPPTVIGGVDGGRFPVEDGHNITLSIKGAEAIRAACLKRGQLWVQGDARPHTCIKVTAVDGEVLFLWLSPAVKPTWDDVLDPPILLSTAPFPARQFAERLLLPDEAAAVRDGLAKHRGAPPITSQPSRWKAVDVPDSGLVYYLIPGKKVPDTNGEETCATTAASVLVKDAHGLRYSGELDALPMAFVLRPGNAIPDAVVPSDCGKQMSLWQIVPKLRAVIGYSNGYEYG
jgi:hypothetical protein